MTKYYSKSTGGFYAPGIHKDIPADAQKISDELHAGLIESQSLGMEIKADASGMPYAAEPSPPSIVEILGRTKSELRTMRAPMLDALTGIAGRAARSGNEALAIEADMLSEHLLDITDDPALNAATDYESMKAAGAAAYKRIAASASDDLKVVFREITGA